MRFNNPVSTKNMTTLYLTSIERSPSRVAFLLIPLVLACFALLQRAQAFQTNAEGDVGNNNTAEGAGALFSITTGTNNTALGVSALNSTTTTSWNTATGAQALKNNIGHNNTADGFQALLFNTTGGDNTGTGWRALFHNTTGSENTATGFQALNDNTTGNGNTASGADALLSNTDGIGNTATGFQALNGNTTGSNNTANGNLALSRNTIGFENTATGLEALFSNTTGTHNTANGSSALEANTTGTENTASGVLALGTNNGDFNTAMGYQALLNNTNGTQNTAAGFQALLNNTGSNNIALGSNAGTNLTTGSNNIDIGTLGVAADSAAIRIGTVGTHTKAFIAGISVSAITGTAVVVNSNGRLGVASSSQRFKDEIKPMDKASEAILALRPVTFRYKPEIDPERAPQFGLVAEEVEKVNPALVSRGPEGSVFTVRYEAVNAMLLNEFLKAHRKMDEQQKEIDALTAQLKKQAALIQKVSDNVELIKPAPQVVLNNR